MSFIVIKSHRSREILYMYWNIAEHISVSFLEVGYLIPVLATYNVSYIWQ